MSLIGRPRKGFNVLEYNRQKFERDRRGCKPCEGRGYFDSRHAGYRGHTTCSWCNGTGRAPLTTAKATNDQ